MSTITADVPTVLAAAIHDRLTEQARAIRTPRPEVGDVTEAGNSDMRTIGQIRADLLCELLLCNDPGAAGPHDLARAITAKVAITIPALSLLGHDTDPALLEGRHPISLDDAAWLAAEAPEWRRILTDPVTGVALRTDRREPSSPQRAFLHARDQHCRQPGCSRPAHRCDLDHTIPWSRDGATSLANLASLCRTHHTNKHHGDWHLEQPVAGELHWRSPTGLTYIDHPDPHTSTITSSRLDRMRSHGREAAEPQAPEPGAPPPPF